MSPLSPLALEPEQIALHEVCGGVLLSQLSPLALESEQIALHEEGEQEERRHRTGEPGGVGVRVRVRVRGSGLCPSGLGF